MIASARVRWALDQGRWHDVEPWAAEVLGRRDAVSLARIQTLVARGRLTARRGDAGAAGTLLDEALALTIEHRRVEPIAAVRPARVEAAWLAGDRDRIRGETSEAAERCAEIEDPWWHGELALWARLAGCEPAEQARPSAPPFALSLAGDRRSAASWWRDRGCRYEAAIALLLAPDVSALREALDTLDRMGARPAADYARRLLRERGVAGLPRGPRASTLSSPAGLTRREHDVLLLVAAGLSNGEIASRLFLSRKTIERHLSGIFRKLDATSRHEAAAAASRLGLLKPRAD
jgi:DNA-binding NarL/FixJ family response regulator